ncbi:MAG: hypothetical protein BIFFINMI_01912 [Phycisphaerae bacterium]|nr:hypothetical protein [Phycisphaerae bacterium]
MGSISRRQFIRRVSGGLAGAAGLAPLLGSPLWAQAADPPTTQPDGAPPAPAAAAATDDLLGGPRSRLLAVTNPVAVKGNIVTPKHLSSLLDYALRRYFGVDSEAAAWRTLVKPGQKVLLKFNRSGAADLNVTDAMLQAMLESLAKADIAAGRIMLADCNPDQVRDSKTAEPAAGWSAKPVKVLGRDEFYSAALEWCDCLINIPFVKDHHLAGVTCAMKNLSHGLIKHPARWHGDGCREAIPHLFAAEPIRSKLRLNIGNALRIVYDGGPTVSQDRIVNKNQLLVSDDAVAMDAYAARMINQERGAQGLKDLSEDGRAPQYLTVARDLKLGQSDLDHVDIIEREI